MGLNGAKDPCSQEAMPNPANAVIVLFFPWSDRQMQPKARPFSYTHPTAQHSQIHKITYSLSQTYKSLFQTPLAIMARMGAALRYLYWYLSTSFRPLLIFWMVAVSLASLYQVLNPTSAHNVGVRIDPLAAVMQEVAFQTCVCILFSSLSLPFVTYSLHTLHAPFWLSANCHFPPALFFRQTKKDYTEMNKF